MSSQDESCPMMMKENNMTAVWSSYKSNQDSGETNPVTIFSKKNANELSPRQPIPTKNRTIRLPAARSLGSVVRENPELGDWIVTASVREP